MNNPNQYSLDLNTFRQKLQNENSFLLDARSANDFTQGFIPGSIFIGWGPSFTEWAKEFIPANAEIIFIAAPEQQSSVLAALLACGFANVAGYLEGGFETWKNSGEGTEMIVDVEPDELALDIPHDAHLRILDVRRQDEYDAGHVKNAILIPLNELKDPASIARFADNDNIYIHCKSGYRSVIASSFFNKEGYHNIRNVLGGFEKIRMTPGISTEAKPMK